MRQPLEDNEKKLLKAQIKTGWIYGTVTFLSFAFLMFLSFKGVVNIEPSVTAFLALFFSTLVIWLLNHDYVKDLKSGQKEIIEKKLEVHDDERKVKKTKVMSLLNAWGKPKKQKKKGFLIHIDHATFEVSEELIKKAEEKGSVKLHYTLYSKRLLKIEA
jgi:hypothetical protein